MRHTFRESLKSYLSSENEPPKTIHSNGDFVTSKMCNFKAILGLYKIVILGSHFDHFDMKFRESMNICLCGQNMISQSYILLSPKLLFFY